MGLLEGPKNIKYHKQKWLYSKALKRYTLQGEDCRAEIRKIRWSSGSATMWEARFLIYDPKAIRGKGCYVIKESMQDNNLSILKAIYEEKVSKKG